MTTAKGWWRVLLVGEVPRSVIDQLARVRAQVVALGTPGAADVSGLHHVAALDLGRPLDEQGAPAGSRELVVAGITGALAERAALPDALWQTLAPGGELLVGVPPSAAAHWRAVLAARGEVRGDEAPPIPEAPPDLVWLHTRSPAAPVRWPPELDHLDRTACVDHALLLATHAAPLWRGPDDAGDLDAPGYTAACQALRVALAEQIAATGVVDVAALPWPSPRRAPSGDPPACDALFVLAHPDDESVYCGGTIARLTASGRAVRLAVATDGAGGRDPGGPDSLAARRARELRAAATALGIAAHDVLGLADFGKYHDRARSRPVDAAEALRRWGLGATLEAITRAVRRHRPRALWGFDPTRDPNYSLHGHHLAVGVATAVAFHLAADPEAFPEHAALGLSPWAPEQQLAVVPTQSAGEHTVDWPVDLEAKRRALLCHASQSFSLARLLDAIAAEDDRVSTERWHLLQARRAGGPPNPPAASTPGRYRADEDRERQRRLAAHPYPRAALGDLLQAQNRARDAAEPVLTNIERLRDARCVAVVTGQQVGLFGGPLYTLHKALGAVRWAELLTAQGIPAVPIFWLASYDHDLREVARVDLLDGGPEPTRLVLPEPDAPTGAPVGGVEVGEAISALLDQLAAGLSQDPWADEVVAVLRETYPPGATFAGAFARWLGRLTDPHGLILLDPADRAFAALGRPLLSRALFDPAPGAAEAIDAGTRAVRARGEAPQVERTPGRLPVFLVDDAGRRRGLQRDGADFRLDGGARAARGDIERWLRAEPERFSPSALLRPVWEASVLPTIAYVAGPSERRYYAQLPPLYAWAALPAPRVIARPSLCVVDEARAAELLAATARPATELLATADPDAILSLAGLPAAWRRALAELDAAAEALAGLRMQLTDTAEVEHDRRWRDADARLSRAQTLLSSEAVADAAWRPDAEIARMNAARAAFSLHLQQVAQARGRLPSGRSLGKVQSAVRQLTRRVRKVGRRQTTEAKATLYRVRPRVGRQERTMSLAQLVAGFGWGVAALLLPYATPGTEHETVAVLARAEPQR